MVASHASQHAKQMQPHPPPPQASAHMPPLSHAPPPNHTQAGTLVACVKLDIERQCGIPMAKQKLTVGGKPLIDPLSLCDCPGISAGRSADVAVAADP